LTALTGCGRVAELLGDEVVAQQIALLESQIHAGYAAITEWQRARGTLRF
jgi:glutamine synthetase